MNNNRLVIFIILALLFIMLSGCTHYSTQKRPEAQNTINAPIDVVWEKTLQILPTERITLETVDKNNFFISGSKNITFWSWGDNVTIKLIPKEENQTIMHFDVSVKSQQLVDWGHSGRMARSIFNRIKTESINAPALHQVPVSSGQRPPSVSKPVTQPKNSSPKSQSEASNNELKNLENKLTKLEEMKALGLVTEEEYLKLRNKIIEEY